VSAAAHPSAAQWRMLLALLHEALLHEALLQESLASTGTRRSGRWRTTLRFQDWRLEVCWTRPGRAAVVEVGLFAGAVLVERVRTAVASQPEAPPPCL
jgi:hypothetical protein